MTNPDSSNLEGIEKLFCLLYHRANIHILIENPKGEIGTKVEKFQNDSNDNPQNPPAPINQNSSDNQILPFPSNENSPVAQNSPANANQNFSENQNPSASTNENSQGS
jgi:hypothetical protein